MRAKDFDFLIDKKKKNVENYGELYLCNSPNNCSTCKKNWNYNHEYEYIKEIKKILPPNSIGIDIGAHTGTYGIALRNYVKTMYSFEPNLYAFYALTMNSTIYPNIIPLRYACGNTCDNATDVAVINLTDFLKNISINFIKLDIDGQELQVLKQLSFLIKNLDDLVVLLEFETKHHLEYKYNEIDFFNMLEACGLNCWDLFNKKIKPNICKTFFCNILIHKKQNVVNTKVLHFFIDGNKVII